MFKTVVWICAPCVYRPVILRINLFSYMTIQLFHYSYTNTALNSCGPSTILTVLPLTDGITSKKNRRIIMSYCCEGGSPFEGFGNTSYVVYTPSWKHVLVHSFVRSSVRCVIHSSAHYSTPVLVRHYHVFLQCFQFHKIHVNTRNAVIWKHQIGFQVWAASCVIVSFRIQHGSGNVCRNVRMTSTDYAVQTQNPISFIWHYPR
jgi:hypothetical protein